MIKKHHASLKKHTNLTPIFGLIFAVFGAILLGKLTRYQFSLGPLTSDIIYPLSFIEWVAAAGCLLGGLYMLYKSFFKKSFLYRY